MINENMVGFELSISSAGSNRSTNCSTVKLYTILSLFCTNHCSPIVHTTDTTGNEISFTFCEKEFFIIFWRSAQHKLKKLARSHQKTVSFVRIKTHCFLFGYT